MSLFPGQFLLLNFVFFHFLLLLFFLICQYFICFLAYPFPLCPLFSVLIGCGCCDLWCDVKVLMCFLLDTSSKSERRSMLSNLAIQTWPSQTVAARGGWGPQGRDPQTRVVWEGKGDGASVLRRDQERNTMLNHFLQPSHRRAGASGGCSSPARWGILPLPRAAVH